MDILKPGNILHIKDYEFEDGGGTRDKYLIVIDVSETLSLLLRVLTTSQLKVPEDKAIHGCRNEPENGLHYYMFQQNRLLGAYEGAEFAFGKDTFILFRNNIKDISLQRFIANYQHVVQCVCTLDEGEFKRLKKCIRQNAVTADRSAKRNFPHIFT